MDANLSYHKFKKKSYGYKVHVKALKWVLNNESNFKEYDLKLRQYSS